MKKIVLFFLGFSACGALFAPALSYAQVQDPTVVKLVNPIGGTKEKPEGTIEIPVILGGILTKALGVMGSGALLMFVIGGAMWLTSAGNSERVQKGTETMVWAAIGVLIIFSSYAILRLVLGGIGAEGLDGSTSGSDNTNASVQVDPTASCIPQMGIAELTCQKQSEADCTKKAYCELVSVDDKGFKTTSCVPGATNTLNALCAKRKGQQLCEMTKDGLSCSWKSKKCVVDSNATKKACSSMSAGDCALSTGCVSKVEETKTASKACKVVEKKIAEYCKAQEDSKCSGECTKNE